MTVSWLIEREIHTALTLKRSTSTVHVHNVSGNDCNIYRFTVCVQAFAEWLKHALMSIYQ